MAAVAVSCLSAFGLIVVALHVVQPDLDPRNHVISEYARTGSGWLLTVALGCWAGSLVASAAVLRGLDLAPVAGLLTVAAVALILAAACPTQAVAGAVPPGVQRTVTGRLHDVGSGLATVSLFLAAALVAARAGPGSRLGRVSLLGVVVAVAVQVALLIVGPSVGGVRERLLVVIACAWQAALLRMGPTTSEAPG
jgi:uncharacterized protein DUF998